MAEESKAEISIQMVLAMKDQIDGLNQTIKEQNEHINGMNEKYDKLEQECLNWIKTNQEKDRKMEQYETVFKKGQERLEQVSMHLNKYIEYRWDGNELIVERIKNQNKK